MSSDFKDLYEFSNFRLIVSERILMRGEERVPIPEKVFETLCVLVANAGRLIEKDELMEKVWGETIVEENNLDKKISALRKILGEVSGDEKFIETVRGHGYRFVADVRKIQTGAETRSNEAAGKEGLQITSYKLREGETSKENPPLGNVIALAGWRREAENENQTNVTAAVEPAPEAATVEKLMTAETALAEELSETQPVVKKKTGVRRFVLPAAILLIALIGIGFAWYKFANSAPMRFEAKNITRLTSSGRVKVAVISPDGKFIAYTQEEFDGRQSLWM
ncbi:MAG TPA: transcriptional regulator, partial [Pyrinomonadaceae bacterium]|nr:transcriptional regulator [Pyrinomonadaceae bacterium]